MAKHQTSPIYMEEGFVPPSTSLYPPARGHVSADDDRSLSEQLDAAENMFGSGKVTVSKEAPWAGEESKAEAQIAEFISSTGLPGVQPGSRKNPARPVSSGYERGDYVHLTSTNQYVVAADYPDINTNECWIVCADEEDWDAVGTFVPLYYVQASGPVIERRLFSDAAKEPARDEDLPPRATLLNEASRLITGERNQSYGSPTENFQTTADMWTLQFAHLLKDGARFTGAHISQAMMHLKLARMIAQPKRDNYLDIAGYAGCGWECEEEAQVRRPVGMEQAYREAGMSWEEIDQARKEARREGEDD